MPDLLIELFSEEIPARMQGRAASDLKKLMTDGLVDAGLTYASAAAFSTPRRLVLTVEGLLAESPTLREERKGPRVDAPEKALEGFLRATGLTRDQLEPRDDKKGQVWFATIQKPGRPADAIVAEVLERTVRNFPWPKSMRWGSGSLRWVRPLHSILCVLVTEAGAETVPLDIDGITAGNTTQGHRFMAGAAPITVHSFDDYAAQLKRAHVMLDPAERADHIWNDATNMAFAQGLEVVEDRGLLAEVAGLVEWPVVLMGAIGADFLDLPPEVLQTSMKEHQKFFSVRNPKTGRIEKFVTVANVETADQGATILAGNQKVLSARLSDAKFFWENDLRVAKAGMDPWVDALDNVTFHNKLGTQAERISRIAALARAFAPRVGAEPAMAEEAARIAKADLSSEMVYEFPELQGLMGRYYAEAAGRDAAVAAAAEEHYRPLGPSDAVPDAPVSVAVALADKLDTLAGFWAIDEKPTGSKDPYALRRAALGVIRIVLSNDLRIQLSDFILRGLFQVFLKLQKAEGEGDLRRDYAAAFDISEDDLRDMALDDLQGRIEPDAIRAGIANLNADADAEVNTPEHLLGFIHDRLKVYLRDQGVRHDVIDACLARPGADDLTLLVKRATALQAFLDTEDGEPLLQGFKRANNILTQAEERDGVAYEFGPDRKYASDPAELALFDALDAAEPRIGAALSAEDYAGAMGEMAGLRAPIDAFFEAVQVNAKEQITRRNRLNLLHRIRETCMTVADLSRLDG
ncbi:MAG: glycine--tRNA ligase subunit beta [Celeribacter sp.]|jgi:glycyl-tRNA synthetase beta chain